MIRQLPNLDELEDIKQLQQGIANKWGCMITLSWNGLHLPISPQKEHEGQLVLDGMEMPRLTEFTGEGE